MKILPPWNVTSIYKQLITETMSSKKHLSILKYTAFFSLLTSVLYISCNIRNHYCISFMNFLYVNTYICLYVLPFLYHHPTPPHPHPNKLFENTRKGIDRWPNCEYIFKIPQSEHIKFIFSDRPFTTCLCHSNLWDN